MKWVMQGFYSVNKTLVKVSSFFFIVSSIYDLNQILGLRVCDANRGFDRFSRRSTAVDK